MKITPMNERRPENPQDVEDLMDDSGWTPDECAATISHDEWEADGAGPTGINMTGYSAEVRDPDGEEVFTTIGFEKRETLVDLLTSAGFSASNISDD